MLCAVLPLSSVNKTEYFGAPALGRAHRLEGLAALLLRFGVVRARGQPQPHSQGRTPERDLRREADGRGREKAVERRRGRDRGRQHGCSVFCYQIILMEGSHHPHRMAIEQQQAVGSIIREAAWSRFRTAYRRKFKKDHEPSVFVVLAAIALVPAARPLEPHVVTVTQGTKSLPACVVSGENRDDLLADMHAEMLAVRGFRRFLLEQARGGSEWLRVNSKGKLALRRDVEVWLYCSEAFCGDCCISHQHLSFSGAKPLAYLHHQDLPNQKFAEDVLRTKPGRLDLPLPRRSALLSCSDLLGVANLLGLQGRTLYSAFAPTYLSAVVVDCPARLKPAIQKGLSLPTRLARLLQRPVSLVRRQIFNIVVQGRERRISGQFREREPVVVVLEKEESRDGEGFGLCGVFAESEEWLSGRTGLPEGSSLSNYRQKGRPSSLADSALAKQFPLYKPNHLSFKYDAILDRLKLLFGEWIEGAGE